MRRHRERRRQRLRCVTVELRDSEITALVRRGLLHPAARSSSGEIVRAFKRRAVFEITTGARQTYYGGSAVGRGAVLTWELRG
jgi:hypothetical protein